MKKNSLSKRFFIIAQALILCLAMMFTAIPQEASAADPLPEIHIASAADWDEMWSGLIGTSVKVVVDNDIILGEEEYLIFNGISGVLDLNGHSITVANGSNYCAVGVNSWDGYNSNLTITGNGSIGFNTELADGSAVNVCDKSKVTIKNGTFSGYNGVSANNDCSVVIEGGTFTGMNAVDVFDNSIVTINSGSFSSKFVACSVQPDDSWGGSWHYCLYDDTEKGKIVINGGTFDSTGAEFGVIRGSHVTINGGTFKGGCPVINVNDIADNPYVFINGGDYTDCTDFFGSYADEIAMDSNHLKVSSTAKLSARQRNQISMAIARGNAAAEEETTPETAPAKPAPAAKPVNYKPAKAVIKKVKPGKKKLNVKWKKVAKATGYNIQVAQNKKFTKKLKKATVKKYTSKGKTIKKLKKGKKYYVRVRAYRVVKGKTYYGAWSKVKKTTVK